MPNLQSGAIYAVVPAAFVTMISLAYADDLSTMGAAADLARKDLQAALALAAQFDLELPLAAMAEEHCGEIFGVGVPSTE